MAQRTSVLFLAPRSGCSQPPVTQDPGQPVPFSFLSRQLHVCTHSHTQVTLESECPSGLEHEETRTLLSST